MVKALDCPCRGCRSQLQAVTQAAHTTHNSSFQGSSASDLSGHCTRECSPAPVITNKNTSFVNNQRGQLALGLPIHTHHNNELQEIHATLGSRLCITGSAVLTSYVKHPRNPVDCHGLAVRTGYSLSEPHVLVLYWRKK